MYALRTYFFLSTHPLCTASDYLAVSSSDDEHPELRNYHKFYCQIFKLAQNRGKSCGTRMRMKLIVKRVL